MSRKDEIKENVQMYRGLIFLNLGCIVGIIAFLFANFQMLYKLDTIAIILLCCCGFGIVALAFTLHYCVKKYKTNLLNLRNV